MVHSTIPFFGGDPSAEHDGRHAELKRLTAAAALTAVVFGRGWIILPTQLQPPLI